MFLIVGCITPNLDEQESEKAQDQATFYHLDGAVV